MDVITFPVNLKTTSDLSILLHGFISLPDATSYDKSDSKKELNLAFKKVLTLHFSGKKFGSRSGLAFERVIRQIVNTLPTSVVCS